MNEGKQKGIVITKIERPPKEIIDGFEGLSTTLVSDAMNRMNSMCAEIKPISGNVHICGPAVTVQCMVGNNIMTHKAIYVAQLGDVIVIDARRHKDTSVWGYIQTVACKVRDITAVVIDGSIRDVKEIRESGFPVFCRGVVPAGPHKGWGDNVNVPIQCGGVSVNPGDVIVGDDDGVVVVPKEMALKIQKLAKKRAEMEKEWLAEVAKGRPTVEVLQLDKKIKDMGVVIR